MCGPCTRRVLSPLTRWKLLNISRLLSSFSICVSLSYSVVNMLHTIIDLEPGLLSWLVSLWQTLSIYIWSIGQSSDRPSCFRNFGFMSYFFRKEPSLPNTFSNDYWFSSQSWFFMWMSLHGSSFADHTRASDNNFQCIFQSTWGVRLWGSSSDISLSRTRLKKKEKE